MEKTAQAEFDATRDAARLERAMAHLEIEKNRINTIVSMLSDHSTVAALLAGCAVAGVSGEALDSFDDDSLSWKAAGVAVYLVFGALALGSSLWVIFISSHLTSLTRDSAQRPKIIEARKILEQGVRDVRGMEAAAMASLVPPAEQ